MARTASTTRNEVSSEVSVFDLVYLIAENRGSMQTQKQLGEVLYKNESEIQKAMKDAAMKYVEPIVFKMAGITPREISDTRGLHDAIVEPIGALNQNSVLENPEKYQTATEGTATEIVSASLQETKSIKSGKK